MDEPKDFFVDQMEQAAIANAANFGTPDCWFCGFCGEKFVTVDSIYDHCLVNPNGECLEE